VLAADAGEDRRYVAVSRVERVAELAVMPANSGQAPLQRRDACRLRAVAGADVSSAGGDSADVSSAGMDAAVGAGGEIQPDRLWVGRQLRKALAALSDCRIFWDSRSLDSRDFPVA
jgi:hypothetical protein